MASSSSSSSSTGGSFIPNYPQAGFLQQVAEYAKQLADQLYSWGQQEFAGVQQLTDQNIAQYQQSAAQALGLAVNNIQRYEQLFQPQENALIADANSYASKERQALEMGQAQATTGMAMEAGRKNALRDLQSYGIDPSAGRYASLDRAERAQAAAAQAGAGQVARQRTEDTGRQLRDRAIQVGQQYPGQAVNALNTTLQGIAGAQNAKLGEANTGVNLFNPALGFLNNAAGLKYPPLGNAGGASSSQTQSSDPNKGSQPPGGPGAGGPGAGPGGPGGPNPYFTGAGPNAPGGPGYVGGPKISSYNFPTDTPTGIPGYQDNFMEGNPAYEPQDFGGSSFDEAGFQNFDYGDPYGGYQPDFAGDYSGYDFQPQQDYGGYDYDPQSYDGGGYQPDFAGDYGGYQEPTQDYGYQDYGDYGYARGGPVAGQRQSPQRGIPAGGTPGGNVPRQASPSQGQRVDDVNANLTVDEFVVPRDVALWKGQEFFQKLIAQSRKARMTAPAAGQPGPSNPGPARFASQAVG